MYKRQKREERINIRGEKKKTVKNK